MKTKQTDTTLQEEKLQKERLKQLVDALKLPAWIAFLRTFNLAESDFGEKGALRSLYEHVRERLHRLDGVPFLGDDIDLLQAYELSMDHLVDFILARAPLCQVYCTDRDALIAIYRYVMEVIETDYPD
jgi:hypothetical protein